MLFRCRVMMALLFRNSSIVNLFKRMLGLEISQVSDIVYVALSILLISISGYLLQAQHKNLHGAENVEEGEFVR